MMDIQVAASAMATRTMLVMLINTLRGKGFVSDAEVLEMFDGALEAAETQQAAAHRFGSENYSVELLEAVRASIQAEIDREMSYTPRDGAGPQK